MLIMAVPVFAADEAATATDETTAEEEVLSGFAFLTVGFDGLTEAPFTGSGNVTDLKAADGIVSATSNGGDPFLNYTPGVSFAADKVDYIIIRMAADSTSTAFQFFFTTDTISWSEAASFKYDFAGAVADDDGFITIKLDTSTCAEWKGTVTGFRLDPFSAEGTFSFDSVVFWSTDTTVEKISFAGLTSAPFGASGDVGLLFVENGFLYGSSKGGDPYLNYNGTFNSFDASTVKAIHFRMKAYSESKSFQLFFTTDTISWSEAASFKVDLSTLKPGNTGWYNIEIDTSKCAEWKGTITNFRLDPFSSKGVFKFGSISFDVALYAAPAVTAPAEETKPTPKTAAPIFDFGVLNYLAFYYFNLI